MPAARYAARTYWREVRRGMAPAAVWTAAVEVFALHHPAWPWPMAEQEAARTVGALLTWQAGEEAAAPCCTSPPLTVLRALAEPVVPGARLGLPTPGGRQPPPFRRTWRLPAAVPPMGVPPLRLPPTSPVQAPPLC